MRVTTTKAHPQGKGRPIRKSYRIVSHGMSGPLLTDGPDCISVSGRDEEGAHVYVEFTLDDSADHLDAIIGRLTDLRAHQRRLREGDRG